jgi:hypothetical protein
MFFFVSLSLLAAAVDGIAFTRWSKGSSLAMLEVAARYEC